MPLDITCNICLKISEFMWIEWIYLDSCRELQGIIIRKPFFINLFLVNIMNLQRLKPYSILSFSTQLKNKHNSSLYRTNFTFPPFICENSYKNLGFANTAFCEFLVIPNKNIGPFVKFNYGYNEQCSFLWVWMFISNSKHFDSTSFIYMSLMMWQYGNCKEKEIVPNWTV